MQLGFNCIPRLIIGLLVLICIIVWAVHFFLSTLKYLNRIFSSTSKKADTKKNMCHVTLLLLLTMAIYFYSSKLRTLTLHLLQWSKTILSIDCLASLITSPGVALLSDPWYYLILSDYIFVFPQNKPNFFVLLVRKTKIY